MTIKEAEQILMVDETADEKAIKQQFRKLMRVHHPDALLSDEPKHLAQAQRINEAYTILQKNAGKRRTKRRKNAKTAKRQPVWKANVRKEAFAERTIYMAEDIWADGKTSFFEVAQGRYEWSPDLEEFSCFMHSIHVLSDALLKQEEQSKNIFHYSEEELKEFRFAYQLKLFHLLARQYISPASCLEKLAAAVTDEKGRKIYCFDTYLEGQTSGRTEQLTHGNILNVISLQQNRITVADAQGKLGYLSFLEDALYYVVIPILQKRDAQVKCVVSKKSVGENRKSLWARTKIKLYLRMIQEPREDNLADLTLAIASVLNEYSMKLEKLHSF